MPRARKPKPNLQPVDWPKRAREGRSECLKSFFHRFMEEECYPCEVCCVTDAREIHHRVPLYHGGKDEPSNVLLLCGTCHHGAPDDPEEFDRYQALGGIKLYHFAWGYAFRCVEEAGAREEAVDAEALLPLMAEVIARLPLCEANYTRGQRAERYVRAARRDPVFAKLLAGLR